MYRSASFVREITTASVVELTHERRGQRLTVAGSAMQQGDEAHDALLVDRERLTRVATRHRAPRPRPAGVSASAGRSVFSARRGRRDHVAVDRLDRGDAFEQEIDAGAARLALVPLVESPAHALRVAVGVAVALHLGVELGQLLGVAGGDLVGRARHGGVELLGDGERGRAGAVEPAGARGEEGAQVGERSGERAGTCELTARE